MLSFQIKRKLCLLCFSIRFRLKLVHSSSLCVAAMRKEEIARFREGQLATKISITCKAEEIDTLD